MKAEIVDIDETNEKVVQIFDTGCKFWGWKIYLETRKDSGLDSQRIKKKFNELIEGKGHI